MNFFDQYEILSKKKHITKMDKCRFLSVIPDTTLSAGCESSPAAIAAFYTDDDIEELFSYWYGYVGGLRRKDDFLWTTDSCDC